MQEMQHGKLLLVDEVEATPPSRLSGNYFHEIGEPFIVQHGLTQHRILNSSISHVRVEKYN